MIPTHRPADPRVHAAARAMARKFVHIVGGILRDEERHEALKEAYLVAREGIEAFAEETP